jgi:hypothetical protein
MAQVPYFSPAGAFMGYKDDGQTAPQPQQPQPNQSSAYGTNQYGASNPDESVVAYAGQYGNPVGGTHQAGTTILSNTGNGNPDLSRNAYEQQAQTSLEAQLAQQRMQEEARLNQEAFASRLARLSSSGGTTGPRVTHGAGADESAARANAFARAKDSAGLNAQAALKSLHAVMSATGRAGSSQEMSQAVNALGEGRSDVNSFIDKQLESELQRAAQVSDMTYQGDITQRGQDAAAKQALQSLIMSSGSLY